MACKFMKEVSMQGESSKAGASEVVWDKLWQLHIPNKIKVFGWRACHGIIPTRDNLARRHVVEGGTYELCKRTSESALHAFWECSVAQDVWAGSMRELQKGAGGQFDFLQLVEQLTL